MRLIDADALIPMMKYTTTDNEIGVFPIRIGFNTIKRVIDEAPTIDAVEVVHCKDCKHYVDAGTIPNKSCCGFCTKLGSVSYYGVDANDYCSFGERKGGDDE